jgi:UTP--glucose-1-phosphate uridylyltransferase
MEVKTALITAAGDDQRTLPLQSLVDRDGNTKTALAILIEEVLSAGIDSIGVVIHPDDRSAYRSAAGEHAPRVEFIEQRQPLGYGHAIHCAAEFTREHPFLLLVSDHLYVSGLDKTCAQQLVRVARAENCAVSAVQATHESKLPFYGAVGGHLVDASQRIYQIENVLEKPTPTEAEQKLTVPGLRSGYYLCFFGMHVLPASLQETLGRLFADAEDPGAVDLRSALAELAQTERYLATELDGQRYDFGLRYGLLTAQLALSLSGVDRDEVLSNLLELMATRLRDA